MSKPEKMFDGLVDCLGVIHPDVCDEAADRPEVEKNHRRLMGSEILHEVRAKSRSHHGHPEYLVLNHHAEGPNGAGWVIVRIAKQQIEPLPYGRKLKARDDFGGKRISDIGTDQAKEITAAHAPDHAQARPGSN